MRFCVLRTIVSSEGGDNMKNFVHRATTHQGKGKGYAKHNTHDFMIDKDVMIENFIDGDNDDLYASEVEFYKTRYRKQFDEQNKKYDEYRQYSKRKTVEEYYKTKRYAPVEKILQYGNVDTPEDEKPDKDTFAKMIIDYCEYLQNWSKEHGDHLHLLNVAIHCDEASIHSQLRYIWDWTDENGVTRCEQTKALILSGVERPDPKKYERDVERICKWYNKELENNNLTDDDRKALDKQYKKKLNDADKYNSPLMTFTEMIKNKWYDICDEYGYPVEREALPRPQKHKKIETLKGRTLKQLQAEEDRLDADRVAFESYKQQELAKLDVERIDAEVEVNTAVEVNSRLFETKQSLDAEIKSKNAELQYVNDEIEKGKRNPYFHGQGKVKKAINDGNRISAVKDAESARSVVDP